MGESPKQNSFDIRLLTLPDRMHVIDNMDVKMRTPLPSMQLWEVEDGPVCELTASANLATLAPLGASTKMTRSLSPDVR